MPPINFVAVTAAAVTAFILGFLFHGPLLGRVWISLADVHPTGKERFSDMVPQMLKNLLANFVTASVLAVIYLFASTSSYPGGTGICTEFVPGLTEQRSASLDQVYRQDELRRGRSLKTYAGISFSFLGRRAGERSKISHYFGARLSTLTIM